MGKSHLWYGAEILREGNSCSRSLCDFSKAIQTEKEWWDSKLVHSWPRAGQQTIAPRIGWDNFCLHIWDHKFWGQKKRKLVQILISSKWVTVIIQKSSQQMELFCLLPNSSTCYPPMHGECVSVHECAREPCTQNEQRLTEKSLVLYSLQNPPNTFFPRHTSPTLTETESIFESPWFPITFYRKALLY